MDPDQLPDDPDLDNPYAPPQSTFAPEAAAYPQFPEIPFAVGPIFNWSWVVFKDRMWPSIYIVWGAVAMNYGISFAVQAFQQFARVAIKDTPLFMLLNFLIVAVTVVIQVWLGIGMNMGLLKIARGEPVSFQVLFSGARYLVTTILAAIVVAAILFAVVIIPIAMLGALVAALKGQSSAGALVFVLGCAALAVFVLYLIARLLQLYYIVIDRNAGVLDSIGLSWQLTRGRAGHIVVIYLLQIVLIIAGLLALCVGLVFTLPLSNLLLVVTYLALGEAQEPRKDQLFEQSWEEDL
jgi:hypothetical protein